MTLAKPFGFVSKSGKFVRDSQLQQYVTKEDSRISDEFKATYDEVLAPPMDPGILSGLLMANTYHCRAVKVKARDTAGLGWTLNQRIDNPSEAEKETLEAFFTEPNEDINCVLDKIMTDYETFGYSFMEVIREGYDTNKQIVSYKHAPAFSMRLAKDKKRYVQILTNSKVWFKKFGEEEHINIDTGKFSSELDVKKRGSEIIMFKNYFPSEDAWNYGMPDVLPVIGVISGDLSRREYNTAFFENYGVPAYAVFITGNYDPGDEDAHGRTDLENTIEEHFQEFQKNPHSTLIMSIPSDKNDVTIDFKPIAMEVKEASFRLYRQDNRDEVLAAHGVPPYRLGIAETGKLGGSTAEESTKIYKMSVIEPRQSMVEAVMNRILNDLEIKTWLFKLAEIDLTNEAHDMLMLKDMFLMGAVDSNTIARHFSRFGSEEFDEGNRRYINNVEIISGDNFDFEGDLASLLSENDIPEEAVKVSSRVLRILRAVKAIDKMQEKAEIRLKKN